MRRSGFLLSFLLSLLLSSARWRSSSFDVCDSPPSSSLFFFSLLLLMNFQPENASKRKSYLFREKKKKKKKNSVAPDERERERERERETRDERRNAWRHNNDEEYVQHQCGLALLFLFRTPGVPTSRLVDLLQRRREIGREPLEMALCSKQHQYQQL